MCAIGDTLGNAFGYICKNSLKGDSLWFKKYRPISFEPGCAMYMAFGQIAVTPYHIYAIGD